MSSARQIAFTALLLTLPLTSVAMLGVEEELSVTVPGLQHDIVAIDCCDINGDGTPEILAADSALLVLYDPATDSIFFADTIEGFSPQKILLADVNRDDVPDAMIAGINEWGTEFTILSYDGASGYATVDSLLHPVALSFVFDFGQAIRELQVADYDFDGQTELLVSFDSLVGSGMSPSVGYTAGLSLLYESFPNQLSWWRGKLLGQVRCPGTGSDSVCIGLRVYSSYSEVGADWGSTSVYPVVLSATGATSETPNIGASIGCPDPYFRWSETRSITQSWATGNIDATTPEIELASSTQLTYICTLEDGGFSSGGKWILTLNRLISPDSSELVWVHETPGLYYSLLCYPDSSGYFFAMLGNTLVQVRGSDGLELNRSNPLPTGTKFWAYPLSDGIPRLINYDGNQVSFYRLDPATSINEDPELSLPTTFTLGQPYPNPFNPATTIPLSLPRRSRVRVESFNLLGQKVAVIREETIPAGDHALTWDASGLPSGIYLIRATTEFGQRTVKALMLK